MMKALLLMFLGLLTASPVLYSNDPSAEPIQNFDFVFIPKDQMKRLLPAYRRKEIRLKAEKISRTLNTPVPSSFQQQMALIQWHGRREIEQHDPNGKIRSSLRAELCRLTSELKAIIPQRQTLMQDLKRLKESLSAQCRKSGRLSDEEYSKCQAMQNQTSTLQSTIQAKNIREHEVLKNMREIRKKLKSLSA